MEDLIERRAKSDSAQTNDGNTHLDDRPDGSVRVRPRCVHEGKAVELGDAVD